MTSTIVGLIAGFVVTAVCIILMLHPEYEDGLIGRLGLGFIALAAMARFLGAADALIHGEVLRLSPLAMTLWIGMTLFLGRHMYRFMLYKRSGRFNWRAMNK